MPVTPESEVEVAAGDKKIKIRGSDALTAIIGMLVCSGLTYLGATLITHMDESRASALAFAKVNADAAAAMLLAVKEMTLAQRDGVQAQREMNCLIALPQDKREREMDFCKRIAR